MFVNNPFTYRKRSALCLGAFLFDNQFEICLQNGSVFCMWRSACNLSMVSDFGVVLGVSVTSGVTSSDCEVVSSEEVAEQFYSWC